MTSRATVAWYKRNVFRKIRTEENCEPRKKLTATGMRKCLEYKNGLRNRVRKQQLRGRMRISDLCSGQPLYLRKERTTTNGIEGCSAGQRSHLGSEGTLNKNLYEIFKGRIAKQIVGTPSGFRRIRNWTLWRCRPPPKRKKRLLTE
jgi:hypothetical protein